MFVSAIYTLFYVVLLHCTSLHTALYFNRYYLCDSFRCHLICFRLCCSCKLHNIGNSTRVMILWINLKHNPFALTFRNSKLLFQYHIEDLQYASKLLRKALRLRERYMDASLQSFPISTRRFLYRPFQENKVFRFIKEEDKG